MNFHVIEGWWLTHLILLDPEWQANIADEHYVAIGTGNTPEEAIEAANLKVVTGNIKAKFALIDPSLVATRLNIDNLALALGLNTSEPIKRRRID